jgi:hypothetical protein
MSFPDERPTVRVSDPIALAPDCRLTAGERRRRATHASVEDAYAALARGLRLTVPELDTMTLSEFAARST